MKFVYPRTLSPRTDIRKGSKGDKDFTAQSTVVIKLIENLYITLLINPN